jgi:UDP-3-O-[3-hydroxymyristoyl] glucosamine N-acyltransferase
MKFAKPLPIDNILQMIHENVVVLGEQHQLVTGINEIHSVEDGNLSFVDHPKYYTKVLNSVATVILIDKPVEVPAGKTLLVCEDPLNAYLQVVHSFVSFHPQTTLIHPTAMIGEGTVIQPGTFVGENVKIGKNCIIHSNVSIYADSIIGDNTTIHSCSVIGADAYYMQRRQNGWIKITSCGRSIIGSNVEIGCNVCIDRGVSGDTSIGDGTKFDNQVQVGHDTHIGARCLISSQVAIAGCTFIDDDCVIWAKSCVNKDIYMAKNTTLLALSALDKSVTEPGTTIFGAPAINVRRKWKEMAYNAKVPELFEEVAQLKKELENMKALLMKQKTMD